ncbi:MAG TPA: DUF58 domain-containing protein [Ktedonobacterales bacterium]|jgi:uncharacterized protein (DUF58 family)|nr:DUF58 domain-containing protein [Ktedonobacterales bacterium]
MRPWQFVVLTLLVAVMAIGFGWRPFWILTYALAIALILSVVWLRLSVRGLTFARSLPGGRAQVGERVEERLSLENHSWVPKLWVQVADGSTLPGHHAGYVSSVGPHQRISWRAKTMCRRRGRFTLGPVTATTGDPLGLFRREILLAPEQELLVLPPVLALANFDLVPGLMPGRGRGSQRSLQTTTNVVTVRNYVPGDPLTRIHWPSTARIGQFMVKEFDLDPTIDVVLLLDLDRDAQAGEGDGSTEEYGVTIASSIAGYLLRQQELAVGLAVNGSGEGSLPLDRGERQLDRILEMLAVVHPSRRTPLAEALAIEETRLARNTVLIIVTPSGELDWPQGLNHLQRRGVRPFVILLDPSSFDEGFPSNSRTQQALVAAGVPLVPVRRGDPLVHVLERGAR